MAMRIDQILQLLEFVLVLALLPVIVIRGAFVWSRYANEVTRVNVKEEKTVCFVIDTELS